MSHVAVRYGPSPTGIPHIGNIRTALFNYLFAKNQAGKFYLRIEDTDQARIIKGAVDKIQESLTALNLKWDGEIVFQSKRLDLYKKHLEILKKSGRAYEDDKAWRFKIDTNVKAESWEDVVHGKVEFPTNVLEDFVIVKSDGFPTYHFASVVDDHLMEISHVMRGDEWISSTPKHLQLYSAFGWDPPEFVHLPPIVGHDKKKLSKREGAKSVLEYISEGYLPEAIVNFLSLLGWSPKGEKEIFALEDLTKEFSLDRINKNSPIFNIEKLDWFNSLWIRRLPDAQLAVAISQFNPSFNQSDILKVISLVKDRLNNLKDFTKLAAFFFEKPSLKQRGEEININKEVFIKLVTSLEKIKNWSQLEIADAVTHIMDKENLTKAQLFRSIGIAISGELVTPPIFPSMELLGKKDTLERLNDAAELK